ncbi:indoleamine 2,3-dioxygenase 2 [Elysia marginata]|uniref:Indoleamine 2,3-dioxygenase 2 n=1 Tax=Elysia marginata TaxID=1093978 RepID=A0AAV4EAJ1_9GAST|nr:indoleamine 2,3-dioxygenase 2 [Elysia marginata]
MWNKLARDMPRLIKEKKMRDAVHKLEELNPSLLEGKKQLKLAHLQLSLITSGYVWQDGDAGVPKYLPRNLAVPFYTISNRLGLQPILTHATLVMANVTRIDPKG